jgi:hypothetical protein
MRPFLRRTAPHRVEIFATEPKVKSKITAEMKQD